MAEPIDYIDAWPGDDRTHISAINPGYVALLHGLCSELLYPDAFEGSEAEKLEMVEKIEELMYYLDLPYEPPASETMHLIRVDDINAWNAGGGASTVNTWVRTGLESIQEDTTGLATIQNGRLYVPAGNWHIQAWHSVYCPVSRYATCRLNWENTSEENIGYFSGSNLGNDADRSQGQLSSGIVVSWSSDFLISLDIYHTQTLSNGLGLAAPYSDFGNILHGEMILRGTLAE